MEEVNKMNNESFWKVMKEGEGQFEGLYEVLVYKRNSTWKKGDFYDARIVRQRADVLPKRVGTIRSVCSCGCRDCVCHTAQTR